MCIIPKVGSFSIANNLLVNSKPIVACLWKGIGLCVNWDPGALLVPAEEPLVTFIKLLLKFVIELPISEDVEEDSLTSLQPFYKIIKDTDYYN